MRAPESRTGPLTRRVHASRAMVETVMEVEELGDELADLDTLEETIASGMQPGGVNAPDSDKKSMGRKAAEYSVDAIPDLDDLDALEQSITAQSGAVPNLEPEPEPEQADDTAPQATERKQFQGLKVGELKQRARAIGVSTGAIDAAIDQADDPKEALIGLILAIKPRTGCAKYLPLCCVRDWWTEDVHPAKQEELAHVFAYFDVDGSGSIDRHELRAVIQDLFEGGHVRHPSDEIVDSLMEAGDKDGDGLIDFPEFVALVTSADLDLHPSLCDRCQNPRRERRCFLRKKPGVRCGPPDDEKFDPHSLPHLAFWVLAKSIMVHTAIGIVLLVLALGADGDVKLSSGLSALMVILASFGLTLTYAGVPASRCWFGVYLLVLIAQVCVSNVLLVPHIFDKACVVNGEEVHDACPAFITSSDQVRDAKDACLAAKNDLNQSYCSFKTDCDLRRTKAGCESALAVYGTVECTWRVDNSGEDGFCNATSAETRCV